MKSTIGLALVAMALPTVPARAGGTTPPSGRQAQLPSTLVMQPVLADFVLSVTDNPTCDNTGTSPCNDTIQGCTPATGSYSLVSIKISGRRKPGPKPPKEEFPPGGQPFSVEESLVGCFALGTNSDNAALRGTKRLTEAVLGQLEPHDLVYQLFPSTVGAALLRELDLASGIPVISRFRTPLTRDDHSAITDPLPSTIRATVEISVLGP